MVESDVKSSEVYFLAKKRLKKEQIKLFKNCLPTFLSPLIVLSGMPAKTAGK